jgi:dynein heavy chain, axonemal
VQDFFDANDAKTLFVYLTNKDELVADTTPPNPSTLKKKSLSIFKKHGQATAANFRTQCTCVEMSPSVLETFLVVAQDVFYPILTNPANQSGWPDVMAKKITQSLHKFLANLYITIGQTKVCAGGGGC